MHLLDDRVQQHKERQEDEEPNRCLIGSLEFAVRVGVSRVSRCGGPPSRPSPSREATKQAPNRRFRSRLVQHSESQHQRKSADKLKVDIAGFVDPFVRAEGERRCINREAVTPNRLARSRSTDPVFLTAVRI